MAIDLCFRAGCSITLVFVFLSPSLINLSKEILSCATGIFVRHDKGMISRSFSDCGNCLFNCSLIGDNR